MWGGAIEKDVVVIIEDLRFLLKLVPEAVVELFAIVSDIVNSWIGGDAVGQNIKVWVLTGIDAMGEL